MYKLEKPNIIKSHILLFLAIASFLKPETLEILGYSMINGLYNNVRILFSIIILFSYFKYMKISKFMKFVFLVFIYALFSTYFSSIDSDLTKCIQSYGSLVCFCMLIELGVKYDEKALIHSMFTNYFILIAFNLIFMYNKVGFILGYTLDDSNTEFSFLSSSNLTGSYMIPASVIGFLEAYNKRKSNNVPTLFLWGMIICSELMIWSATSMIGIFLLIGFGIILLHKKMAYHPTFYRILIIGSILALVLVTFFNVQDFFSNFLETYLHKDATMTGRTNVWQIGFIGFSTSPIFGCGYNSQTIDNGLVQVLFNYGILGILLFSGLFLVCYKRLTKYAYCNNLSIYFIFMMSVCFIMAIAEVWPILNILFMFCLAYNLGGNVLSSLTKMKVRLCRP